MTFDGRQYNDQYILRQNFNQDFAEIENCDIERNPTWEGFNSQDFFLRKRDWVQVVEEVEWTIIKQKKAFWWTIFYTDTPKIYFYDWENLEDWTPEEDIIYDDSFDRQIFQTTYLWGWRYPDDETEYTVLRPERSNLLVADNDGIYVYTPEWEKIMDYQYPSWYSSNHNELHINPFDNYNTIYFLNRGNYTIYKITISDFLSGNNGEETFDITNDIFEELDEGADILDIFLLPLDEWKEFWIYLDVDGEKIYIMKMDSAFNKVDFVEVEEDWDDSFTYDALVRPNRSSKSIPFTSLNGRAAYVSDDLEIIDHLWSQFFRVDSFSDDWVGFIWYDHVYWNYYVWWWDQFYKYESILDSPQTLGIEVPSGSWDSIDILDSFSLVIMDDDGKVQKINRLNFWVESTYQAPPTPDWNIYDNITVSSDWTIYILSRRDGYVLHLSKDFEVLDDFQIDSFSVSGGTGYFFQALRQDETEFEQNDIHFEQELKDDEWNVNPEAYINKYVYIKSKAEGWVNESQYQWRFIRNVKTEDFDEFNKTLVLSRDWDIPLNGWDTAIFFNRFAEQFWFPQIRRESNPDELLSIDNEWNIFFWDFPDARRFVEFDNRMFKLPREAQWLVPSLSTNYQIFDIDNVVNFYDTWEIVNIDSVWWALMVFFKHKIWAVTKVVLDEERWEFLYDYDDVFKFGLYSPESYNFGKWWLRAFGDDHKLYTLSFDLESWWVVNPSATDQWEILQDFFDDFDGWEVYIYMVEDNLRVVYKWDGFTNIYKYYSQWKWWIKDSYKIWWTYWKDFVKVWPNVYSQYENKLVKRWGIDDLWENIKQRLVMYWPKEWQFRLLQLLWVKIKTWFDYHNKVDWDLKVISWAGIEAEIDLDIGNTRVIKDLNASLQDTEWTFWETLIWKAEFGWWVWSKITGNIAEVFYISAWLNLAGDYYKVVLENNSDKQFYFGWLVVVYTMHQSLSNWHNYWNIPLKFNE